MRKKNPELYQAIKTYVERHYEKDGRSPTVREIEAGTGITRPTVQRYLTAMRESGEIEYNGIRGVRTMVMNKTDRETAAVGMIGVVACGTPIYAEENIEEYYRFPVALLGQGTYFMLRAKGQSMVDAGISDGDLVLVRQQNTAEPGQIVVALIDDEATLKRFYPEPENQRIRLHPENETMEDIYVENCLVQGVAVKVLKDLV